MTVLSRAVYEDKDGRRRIITHMGYFDKNRKKIEVYTAKGHNEDTDRLTAEIGGLAQKVAVERDRKQLEAFYTVMELRRHPPKWYQSRQVA